MHPDTTLPRDLAVLRHATRGQPAGPSASRSGSATSPFSTRPSAPATSSSAPSISSASSTRRRAPRTRPRSRRSSSSTTSTASTSTPGDPDRRPRPVRQGGLRAGRNDRRSLGAVHPRRINLVSADLTLPPGDPPADLLASSPEPELKELARSLWSSLQGARDFGSLLHPERTINDAFAKLKARDRDGIWANDDKAWTERRRTLLGTLERTFEREAESTDLGQHLFGEQARRGLSFVQALRRRYDVVVANPPYAGSKNLATTTKDLLQRDYPSGKRDLYAAFIVRCQEFARSTGYVGMVTQQGWMFLRSFPELRADMLQSRTICTIAQLGEHAFEETAAAGAFVAAFTMRCVPPSPEHRLVGIRAVGPVTAQAKAELIRGASQPPTSSIRYQPRQLDLLSIRDHPFVYWLRPRLLDWLRSPGRLSDIAEVRQGMYTADNERFLRCFWECDLPKGSPKWRRYAKGGAPPEVEWTRMAGCRLGERRIGNSHACFPFRPHRFASAEHAVLFPGWPYLLTLLSRQPEHSTAT